MATRDPKFGKADPKTITISPLGAAIVEALPDRKRKQKIERTFRQLGECPTSELFDAAEVESFYAKRGQSIKAV